MRLSLLRVGLLSFMAVSLANCGGDGSQPLTTSTAPAVLTTFSANVLQKLPTSNTAPALPATGITTFAVQSATACEQSTPTTPVDADSDAIALTKTSTFDCTNQSNSDGDADAGNFLYTRKGSYKVEDLDDTVAGVLGGMRVEFNLDRFDYTNTATGETGGGSYKGFWDYRKVGGTLTSTSDFTGGYSFLSESNGYDVDYTYNYSWKWSLTPDDINAAWTTGAISYDGTFTMSGRFMTEQGNQRQVQEGTYTVRYYTQNTEYDSSCAKWYRSGSVFLDDRQGNQFEIRYACATAKLYMNGAESDLWTP